MPKRRLVQRVPLPVRQAIVAAAPGGLWERISPVVHGETGWQRDLGRRRASYAVRRERRSLGSNPSGPDAIGSDPIGSKMVPLRTGGRFYLARVVHRFTADDALNGNLEIVADCLARAGVEYVLVSAQPASRRVVMVPASLRAPAVQALQVLRDGIAGRAVYVTDAEGEADVLRVFEVLAAPGGSLLAGPPFGCDIEFWTDGEDGLRAPRPNRYAVELPADQRSAATRAVGGRRYPTYPAFLASHAFDVTFPIDIVYTWVDGADAAWLAKKQAAWSEVAPGTVSDLSANASRFLSRDELRYSLRSVQMYANWVRTIYLVTDDQVPTWLDTSDPRIRMVSHREVFGDTGHLPTFNSHAIESRLHRIEGLAEHYLYLNDDVFFGRSVSPEMFFHGNGLSKFFLSRAHVPLGASSSREAPVMSAGKNNRDLLQARFGRAVTHRFKHVPHPQQRQLVNEMEQVFAADFERTSRSQFRHPHDVSIASALHHYYAWFTGRAVPGDIRYYYADIGAPQTSARLRRLLRERDYDAFCLNDHDSDHVDPQRQAELIRGFLSAYFLLPSSFERPAAD